MVLSSRLAVSKDLATCRLELAEYIGSTYGVPEYVVREQLRHFAHSYPYSSLVLWVTVRYDGCLRVEPVFEGVPFVWRVPGIKLEVEFCKIDQLRSKAAAWIVQGKHMEACYLRFHEPERLDGFKVCIFDNWPDALASQPEQLTRKRG